MRTVLEFTPREDKIENTANGVDTSRNKKKTFCNSSRVCCKADKDEYYNYEYDTVYNRKERFLYHQLDYKLIILKQFCERTLACENPIT